MSDAPVKFGWPFDAGLCSSVDHNTIDFWEALFPRCTLAIIAECGGLYRLESVGHDILDFWDALLLRLRSQPSRNAGFCIDWRRLGEGSTAM